MGSVFDFGVLERGKENLHPQTEAADYGSGWGRGEKIKSGKKISSQENVNG
jgi:hypothetical protein